MRRTVDKMPAVSVVIPTYNREETISRSIDSVLAQTFDDFELIVVDDASTDNTATVVDQYDDPRVQFVSHDENRGGSAARNTGIAHAEGEYIALLDSDDEWEPTKLQHQVDCLSTRSDEWVAAYCGYHVEIEGWTGRIRSVLTRVVGSEATSSHGREGGEELIPEVLMMQLPTGGASTLIVKRDAINKIDRFDETFQRHQDWEFLIRLLHAGKLAYLNEDLVIKHDTSSPPLEIVERSKQKYLSKFEEEIEAAENAGYDVTRQHQFDLARYHFREGKFREGLTYIDTVQMLYQQNLALVRSGMTGTLRTVRESVS